MNPTVMAELGRSGLVTRRFAVKAGTDPVEIDRLVRAGHWVKVWRGTYTLREVWESLDDHVGKPRLRARAACAHMYTRT